MNSALAFKETPQAVPNRLVGWLVSYDGNDLGVFHELRAGRYILGSDKSNDKRMITLSEGTISGPHLALHAGANEKLTLQDIFSEHGTYVTKAGTKNEMPVKGPLELGHGDWIRIGRKIKFQVCLIHGGSK